MDLERGNDWVPREDCCYSMIRQEWQRKVLQDMYKDIETMVMCAAGITYRLKVHQDNR